MFVHFHMPHIPITIDLFLQAITIPNALVIIVIISSLFLWGTPAPIVEVIAKLNELLIATGKWEGSYSLVY